MNVAAFLCCSTSEQKAGKGGFGEVVNSGYTSCQRGLLYFPTWSPSGPKARFALRMEDEIVRLSLMKTSEVSLGSGPGSGANMP